MKKLITLFFLAFTLLVNAQAEIVNLPNGYTAQFILRQENNIFYIAGTLGSDLHFFRYNIDDNSVVEYTNTSSIPIFSPNGLTNWGKYNFMHNGKFYQNYNNFILVFDDINNTVNEAFGYNNGTYPIKHNNIFVGSEQIRNLNTNLLSTTIAGVDHFFGEFVLYNNDIIALAGTGGNYNKIVKIDSNDGSISVLKTAPSGFYFQGLINPWTYRQSVAGQYLIYRIYDQNNTYNYNLASLNLNNSSDYNDNLATLSTIDINNLIYFNIGNNLYIQDYVSNVTKYTDGNNFNIINIPVFQGNGNAVVNAPFGWANGYGGDSYFKLNNKIYGLRQPNPGVYELYESNGTEAGTILKNTSTISGSNLILPSGTRVYNNVAYFFNGGIDKIYKFDGVNFYKLYDTMLNGYGSSNSEAFYHNNYLFFKSNTNPLVRLNLNQITPELITLSTTTLSTQETPKPIIKLYPNPTKSQLNFSEELSEIKIVDMSGRQVSTQKEKSKTINVEKLPKGNYLISAKYKNGKTVSEKFIKE